MDRYLDINITAKVPGATWVGGLHAVEGGVLAATLAGLLRIGDDGSVTVLDAGVLRYFAFSADGKHLCGTDVNTGAKPDFIVLRRYTVDGKKVWERNHDIDDGSGGTIGVAVDGDGCAVFSSDNQNAARLRRYNAKGDLALVKAYNHPGAVSGSVKGIDGDSLAELGDDLVMTGDMRGLPGTLLNSTKLWTFRTDRNGNVKWDSKIGGTISFCEGNHVVTDNNGIYVGARWEKSSSPTRNYSTIIKYSHAGNVMWMQHVGGYDQGYMDNLSVRGGVIMGTAGDRYTDNADHPVVMRIGANGSATWARFELDLAGQGTAIAVTDNGYWAAVRTWSSKVLYLRRRDIFGNETCGAATACLSKTEKDCDDGNVCTWDFCNTSKKGCYSVPADDGTWCGGGKTCKAGVCK